MEFPALHVMGTSAEQLIEQYTEALGALRGAIRALNAASPNARDYYLDTGEHGERETHTYLLAATEHTNRLARLETVRGELEELLESVVNANDTKKHA